MSRGEITLPVPPPLGNERDRRMSRHDALALTPINQLLTNTNKGK